MKITSDMLRRAYACSAQLEMFEREWPEGAEVTLANVQRAAELDLDLGWFATLFFSSEAFVKRFCAAEAARLVKAAAEDAARDAYEKAVAPARAVFDKATAPARVAYYDATSAGWAPTAWAAYRNAIDGALEIYQRVNGPAMTAYEEALAAAHAAYRLALANAFFEAFELKDPATELASKC